MLPQASSPPLRAGGRRMAMTRNKLTGMSGSIHGRELEASYSKVTDRICS